MQLHDPTVDATTRHRAAPPENDLQKINIALRCNVSPHRISPQRSRRCPVIEQCLQWALESGQESGVWGGLSEDERRALKRRTARQRQRAQHGSAS
ncbi:WhiB family transcriptional regulator [Streptomyces marianii]|uniref:WhiB family transcriptional regulator n=1 Tax=Streptomyces marianii TaxID=1817406 RepID=A0A5R9DXI5_9ACTN|nr:WhiB family transcriptional regulator [Streptomyces marianii]